MSIRVSEKQPSDAYNRVHKLLQMNQACKIQQTLTFSWKRTVATAKGMQDADIPTSAIAKLTNSRCSWFRIERFQNTTRHTEMLPRIPTSVVIPSNIPMIRIIPDNGMLYTIDAQQLACSWINN